MTKYEAQEIQRLERLHAAGEYQTNIAISLSSLIRSAKTKKSENELYCLAINYFYVSKHPEFKI